MGIATAIGLGASALGSVLGSKSQNKAAARQAEATTAAADRAAQVQRQNFVDTAALYLPRIQAGDAATSRMLQLMGLPVPESLTSGQAYSGIFEGGGGSGGGDQYANYVDAFPDLQKEYSRISGEGFGSMLPDSYDANGDGTLDKGEYGRFHYNKFGSGHERFDDFFEGGGGAGGVNGLAGGASSQYGIDVPEVGNVTDLIKSTPGYQFRFDEGINAVDSSAANRGMLMSGSQMRRLQEFGDDYAAREFGNYWNRLAGISGAGQTATAGTAGASANTANNLSSIYQNEGQGLATSYGNRTSTAGNTLGLLGGAALQYYG